MVKADLIGRDRLGAVGIRDAVDALFESVGSALERGSTVWSCGGSVSSTRRPSQV